MSDEDVEKIKKILDELAEILYNVIKPAIEDVYNKLKDIVETIFIKKADKRIQKKINIYLRTKSYKIKKKQLKLIVREMQVYFI